MSRTKQASPAATLRQVAEAAGVSIATASRVLNGVTGKATAETVARVRDAAARLAYRPLAAARDLRRGRGDLVALLAPNLANPTMAAIAASIEAALRADGIGVILCDTHDQPGLQDQALAAMRALRPRATVLLGAVRSPGLDAAHVGGERLLFVARRCPGDPAAPFVGIDDRAAGRAAAEALIAQGAKRLAVIHGPLFSSATADRLAGFREAAGRRLAVADVQGGEGLDHLDIGARAAGALLARGALPDGILCTSDLIAFAAHRVLVDAGLSRLPPVWGFDGGPLNGWVAPWLSSVVLPFADYGAAVRDWVLDDSGGAAGRVLPFTLSAARRDAGPALRPASARSARGGSSGCA
jgi:LacI family transcriptional regulator